MNNTAPSAASATLRKLLDIACAVWYYNPTATRAICNAVAILIMFGMGWWYGTLMVDAIVSYCYLGRC